MSVRKEPSGRRSIQVEVEVPGTPEQVWNAIATGPGISAWFVPARVEGREGGEVVYSFGPGFDAKARITEWRPPHRLVKIGEAEGDKPGLAAEWTVEAKGGSTCIVRVVNSYFASGDDWDGELEGMESGWPAFFEILRRYLAGHRGKAVANVQAMAMVQGGKTEVWQRLLAALGAGGLGAGDRCRTAPSAPPLAGEVIRNEDGAMLVELVEPGAGYAFVSACGMGEQVMLGVNLYLYGDGAAAVAAEQAPGWQEWLPSVAS